MCNHSTTATLYNGNIVQRKNSNRSHQAGGKQSKEAGQKNITSVTNLAFRAYVR